MKKWLKSWSGVLAVALVIVLVLTLAPAEVTITGEGVLSIDLRTASADPGWLSDWDQRVKLTTDNTDITSTLTNFPTLLYISTSSGRNSEDISFIFDELTADANRFKIAVTTDDGETQCYVEIEKWDDANEKAWLWVKAPSISNSADTDFYLYYDVDHANNTDYVGDPNSTPAETVWDSNFKFVSHMRDDPDTSNVRDSTSNDNDGAKQSATNPAVTTSGKISDAQHFDGSSDYVSMNTASIRGVFDAGAKWTVEFWINPDTSGEPLHEWVFSKAYTSHSTPHYQVYSNLDNSSMRTFVRNTAAGWYLLTESSAALTPGTWYHYAHVCDLVADELRHYLDGAQSGAVADTPVGTYANYVTAVVLGANVNYLGQGYDYDGRLDEVRISNTNRSAAWLKATYESGRDDLLDWGSEELAGCSEDISSTPSSWSVNSGTPVDTSSTYTTGLTHFQITNNSGGAIDIDIRGTDMTGGNTWTLSDTATPGSMTYGLKAGLDGGDYTIIVKKNSPYNDLVTGLADSGTQDWGLKLYTPTVYTDGATKTGTVTITAVCV